MAKLSWGAQSARSFEHGVDRVIVYPTQTSEAEVWTGVSKLDESTDDTELRKIFVEGSVTIHKRGISSYKGSVSSYTYPEIIETSPFHLSYRTLTQTSDERSYRLHLVYSVVAEASNSIDRSSQTESGYDPSEFGFSITAASEEANGYGRTDHIIVDSRYVSANVLAAIESILYGEIESPRIPLPNEIITIADQYSLLRITDHGDGTWSADGPDDMVTVHGDGTFTISSPSLRMLTADSYFVKNY